jgi:hypothetical protein
MHKQSSGHDLWPPGKNAGHYLWPSENNAEQNKASPFKLAAQSKGRNSMLLAL